MLTRYDRLGQVWAWTTRPASPPTATTPTAGLRNASTPGPRRCAIPHRQPAGWPSHRHPTQPKRSRAATMARPIGTVGRQAYPKLGQSVARAFENDSQGRLAVIARDGAAETVTLMPTAPWPAPRRGHATYTYPANRLRNIDGGSSAWRYDVGYCYGGGASPAQPWNMTGACPARCLAARDFPRIWQRNRQCSKAAAPPAICPWRGKAHRRD